jgi:peroxiredoxin
MVQTASQMLELGTQAPRFELPDFDGTKHALGDPSSRKATLVMFICNHCPYVKHMREQLAALGTEYGERGVAIFAINSNDYESYPDDSPARMKDEAQTYGYPFPYLVDADQSVAKSYRAACTPDFFLFDGQGKLAYRGQLDSSRPSNDDPVDGKDLRAAMDALLQGKQPSEDQTPSIGCNIKWKPGNAPDYFG